VRHFAAPSECSARRTQEPNYLVQSKCVWLLPRMRDGESMNMSHHLTTQLATERQRDLRAGGAKRGAEGLQARALRPARTTYIRSAVAWRPRARSARRAERVSC